MIRSVFVAPMKCFFHLASGTDELLDAIGVAVADVDEARTEALDALAELRREEPDSDRDWSGWELRAVDGSGTPLFTIPLSRDGSANH
jgi:hypothetical protein